MAMMNEGDRPDKGALGEQRLRAGALSEAFFADESERRQHGLPVSDDEPMSVVVELNLFHEDGLSGAFAKFEDLYHYLPIERHKATPVRIADTYVRCELTINETKELVRLDQAGGLPPPQRAIYRVWPDFPMRLLIDRSVATIKGDAARRSYDASGSDIVWAVIDSGIDGTHPHFATFDNLGGSVKKLHRDFTVDDDAGNPLADEYGHGTHVAGVIAGALCRPGDGQPPKDPVTDDPIDVRVGMRVAVSDDSTLETVQQRKSCDITRLAGVAPRCKLISLKVLDEKGKRIRSTDVLRALEYVRVELNGHGKPPLRVQGVNISLGYEFNARWFACGQSPVCIEVDRLVRTGVVVVIAAGNTGYGELSTKSGRTNTGLALTINDPANAAFAISVGATHRDSPYTYGVSYFSSKGPTGDGRAKPDLVAPGERITSCAAGKQVEDLKKGFSEISEPERWAPGRYAGYIDLSGTSMAAPHVSGAIASFLSIRREFIGQPEEVKRIFLTSATSLGREKYFEGHGLVDLMRAIQSV
jgi:subtilisin family serine protease